MFSSKRTVRKDRLPELTIDSFASNMVKAASLTTVIDLDLPLGNQQYQYQDQYQFCFFTTKYLLSLYELKTQQNQAVREDAKAFLTAVGQYKSSMIFPCSIKVQIEK